MIPYNEIKYREEEPIIDRHCCTDSLLKQLRDAGIETDGYAHSMEKILQDKGFGLPFPDDEYFAFMVNYKYIGYYLNYADSLAELILLLVKLNLL